MSASTLALKLHKQKAAVLEALHQLEAEARVTFQGRGRAGRWHIAPPETQPHVQAPVLPVVANTKHVSSLPVSSVDRTRVDCATRTEQAPSRAQAGDDMEQRIANLKEFYRSQNRVPAGFSAGRFPGWR